MTLITIDGVLVPYPHVMVGITIEQLPPVWAILLPLLASDWVQHSDVLSIHWLKANEKPPHIGGSHLVAMPSSVCGQDVSLN